MVLYYMKMKYNELQRPLPKLPVPDLHRTLTKYEDILQPILTPIQLKKAKELILDFSQKGGHGEHLQELLALEAETKENWVNFISC